MASGLRFNPPRVSLSAEESWVLARAFGPREGEHEPTQALRGEGVVEAAEGLDLAERIAHRVDGEALAVEVGEEAAGFFRRAHTGCAARSLIVDGVVREVAIAAADLGCRAVFLKGAALQLGEWAEAGSRTMSDVDVLVAEAEASRLQDLLIEKGCASPDAPVSEHQLQLLTHPTGLGVEVHRVIPGVRLDGAGFATAEHLLEGERCRRIKDLPGDCFIPDRPVLVAHCLAHGVAQHGLAPDTYPFARFLADLQDLGVTTESWLADAPVVLPWIESHVSAAEIVAVVDLMDRLCRGDEPVAVAGGDDPAGTILRHLVAGATRDDYITAMRVARRARPLSERPRWQRLARDAWRTVWLTRPQIDQLYGAPDSELGYWGRRLWRPFDLVGRAWRYTAAALRHRLSGRSGG